MDARGAEGRWLMDQADLERCIAFAIEHGAEFEPIAGVPDWWQFRWPAADPRRPQELRVCGEGAAVLALAIESVGAGYIPGVALDPFWNE